MLALKGRILDAIWPYFAELFTNLDMESEDENMISYFDAWESRRLFHVMHEKFLSQEKIGLAASDEVYINVHRYRYNPANDPWLNGY